MSHAEVTTSKSIYSCYHHKWFYSAVEILHVAQTSTVHLCKSCLHAFKSLSEVKFSTVLCLPLGRGCTAQPWGCRRQGSIPCLVSSLQLGAQAEALWATLLRCAGHQRMVPGNAGERPMGGTFFHGCSCLHSTCTSWSLLPAICWHFSFTQWMQTALCLMQ